ncbi:hypothetical protein D9M73_211500 [compost metagenome]
MRTKPDLWRIEGSVGTDEMSIQGAVEAVAEIHAGGVIAPQQRVGNAQIAQQRRNPPGAIDAEQSTGTVDDGQVFAVCADVVLHGAEPEPALGVATGFIGAVARLRIGNAKQCQARRQAR